MPDPQAVLRRLCALAGIATGYHDIYGRHHAVSDANLAALLAQWGIPVDLPGGLEQAERAFIERHERPLLAPALVVPAHSASWSVHTRAPAAALEWRISEEGGAEHRGGIGSAAPGDAQGLRFTPGVALPMGCHRIRITAGGAPVAQSALLAVPSRGWQPAAVELGARLWGVSVQLYGLRSARNWGIGDFGDLTALIEIAAARGASAVGLNPLHALFDHDPQRCSPYSPSSRAALNALYLDVEAIEDFAECGQARCLAAGAAFQARLGRLRASPLVDYRGVAAAKSEMLALLFRHFRERHLAAGTARALQFREFRTQRAGALRCHALYEALQAHFNGRGTRAWGWQAWPEAYRDPQGEAIERFARENEARVEYFEYLQWQAAVQLERAAARCEALGMAVGLYLDLAVSVDRGGSDAWGRQDCYALAADLGAPPDDFAPQGQKWGLPPLRPECLRNTAYLPLREALAACMAQARALRIDHVMGLARLFWIPPGGSAADGAYVHYPLEDMFSVVALESHRNRSMVIGEDLGTVPDSVREAMARYGFLSYRLLYFEREHDAEFRLPDHYPRAALVAITTHDLPTLAGWWCGADIELRCRVGLAKGEALLAAQLEERRRDRERLLRALKRTRLLPEGAGDAVPERLTPELSAAIHAYAACTPAVLAMAQLEDMLGLEEQANLPGTVDEHPNWRRRIPVPLEDIARHPGFVVHAAALARIRPR
ncbi:MAG: 4-alpha-glucanotransferase [Burkholderiales bacterium]|nr:4-alpha-glucanotransferase [Burkholderiales bacterium]